MLVYRFEHEYEHTRTQYDGRIVKRLINEGIFSTSIVTYTTDALYQTHGCTLYEYKSGQYRFACSSIDKLIEYFGSDFARIIGQDGVRLMEYEVKRQKMFFSSVNIEVVFKIDDIISKRRIA